LAVSFDTDHNGEVPELFCIVVFNDPILLGEQGGGRKKETNKGKLQTRGTFMQIILKANEGKTQSQEVFVCKIFQN
jgi:hypothetical protein